ncbi:MAG: helix-turn-helix domain-containing protein [Bdellovibrionales bacterium]|nr:helix-turn-helix domain-containing protein [Bdellovibrionales bacterium]NQZ18329.1 helix-turn-helix domain-containing protein [Bdellovibrionales bacterium]
MKKRNLRVSEFIEVYGICKSRIYQEINSGRLKVVKSGRSTLIPVESAEEWQSKLVRPQVQNG